MTQHDLKQILEKRNQYLVIEKQDRYSNIENLVEFIEGIKLTRSEKLRLNIEPHIFDDILYSSKEYVSNYSDEQNNKSTKIQDYQEYKYYILRLMNIISSIIPEGYYVTDKGDKVVIEKLYEAIY